MASEHRNDGLKDLALLFLKIGATAFGGPAAHIAMMEEQAVRRRQWLTRESFLDLLGATNLIPGPNSTELAMYIGYLRAGWLGLVVAGVSFILPAVAIVTGVAWAYVSFGKLPEAAGLLYGIKPVIIAIVLQALFNLGRTAIKTKFLAALFVGAILFNSQGVNEILLLFLGTVLAMTWYIMQNRPSRSLALFIASPTLSLAQIEPLVTSSSAVSITALFAFFLKVGSVLFGSGYVLLAFLRADLVENWRWLTESQLLDAIAVGQFTPGPVFTTATFIGYLLAGPIGAAVATVGLFLPAFIFVAMCAPFLPRLRSSVILGKCLDGVTVVSLALLAVVAWQLARGALVDKESIGIFLVSVFLLVRFRMNSAWLVLAGAVAGILKTLT